MNIRYTTRTARKRTDRLVAALSPTAAIAEPTPDGPGRALLACAVSGLWDDGRRSGRCPVGRHIAQKRGAFSPSNAYDATMPPGMKGHRDESDNANHQRAASCAARVSRAAGPSYDATPRVKMLVHNRLCTDGMLVHTACAYVGTRGHIHLRPGEVAPSNVGMVRGSGPSGPSRSQTSGQCVGLCREADIALVARVPAHRNTPRRRC